MWIHSAAYMCIHVHMTLHVSVKNSLLNALELTDEPAAADNPWRNENDEFRCTGNADMSCFSKITAALARPSYAPSKAIQTDDDDGQDHQNDVKSSVAKCYKTCISCKSPTYIIIIISDTVVKTFQAEDV